MEKEKELTMKRVKEDGREKEKEKKEGEREIVSRKEWARNEL